MRVWCNQCRLALAMAPATVWPNSQLRGQTQNGRIAFSQSLPAPASS